MADSFFKLKDSLNEYDEKYHDLEEDEYDALNDETFGADATVIEDDWEDMHTKLAAATESTRNRSMDFNANEGLDLEKSLSNLVLSDDMPIQPRIPANVPSWAPFGPSPLMFEKPFQLPLPRAQPPRIMTVDEIERQMMGKDKMPPRASAGPLGPFIRSMRPAANNMPMAPQPLLNRPVFPPQPSAVFPGFPPPMRPQTHRPLPPPQFVGPGQRPPGFIGNMMPSLMNQPIGRPHPHPIPGKPGLGMFPTPMPPDPVTQKFMLRAHMEKIGMPIMMQRLMQPQPPPPPPPGLVLDPRRIKYDHFCQQLRMVGQNAHPLMAMHQHQQALFHQHQQRQLNRNNDRDDYAKLMNNRERTWILNIQILMLALKDPQVDDYYYYMWKKRHPVLVKPKPLKNGFNKDQRRPDGNHRERRDSESTTSSQRVYVPLQYENSLGKLQAKSVNAPRMVFDVETVSDSQTATQTSGPHKDHRKTKKILLELERLYLLIMEAEEAEVDPVNVLVKEELVHKVLVGLLNDERFLSFLCIRKGKTLFLRCFGHVVDCDWPMFNDLWAKLLKAFPTVLRRDKDDAMLPKFYPFFRKWAQATSWQGLMTVAKSLLAGTRDGRTSLFRASPSPSRPVLTYILTNQFGISAVAKIVQQGEQHASLLLDHETVEWKSFIEELVKSMANLDPSERTLRPIEPIAQDALSAILDKRCSHLASHLHAAARRLLSS